ncbi:hypothetical protein GGP53_000753 [Salinibacter ruber]|nr:hypothetical protein [Salinibacter ruber]MCS4143820.1 hypothetical protein [Salinibacter ruber]
MAEMLRQHPEICIPQKKEVHFFNKKENYSKGVGWYERHFEACTGSVCGEATPNYLWTSNSERERQESGRTENIPKLIRNTYPNLKFIVSLREPVDRAVSAYKTLIRGGHISPSRSITEVSHRHGIITMGDYETHIRRWFEYFSPSQFLFLVFEEEIKENRQNTIQKIYRFLDVDPAFIPDGIDEHKHPSLGPFYRTLLYYLPWIRPVTKTLFPNLRRDKLPFRNSLRGRDVTSQEREQLKKHFSHFNDNLPDLIGREPVWWSGNVEYSAQ